MGEDRLLSAWLHGGFAVQMLVWGGLFGCALSFGLGALERRGRALPRWVWWWVPGALGLLALLTSGARLQQLEMTLQTTGARWVLSRMAHHAASVGEPLWVCGVMVMLMFTCMAWVRVGGARTYAVAAGSPVRFACTAACGALSVGWLSEWGVLETLIGTVCSGVLCASGGLRGVGRGAAVVGVWTLGWTGWISQWDALVLGSPVEDLATLRSLPGWYVPWLIAGGTVGGMSWAWRGQAHRAPGALWPSMGVCAVGVLLSWSALPQVLPWAPSAALQGLLARVALPTLEVDEADLYGRVGGGCLREWTEEGWVERSLPWVDGSNGMPACGPAAATVAVAVPADLPLGALPSWEGVRTLLWVTSWAPGDLPGAFDAWRYVIVPSRLAPSGDGRRGQTPVRLVWTREGWGVQTGEGVTTIADKPFREWLPDIQRGELILTFHPETPAGAVVDLCHAARHTKDALLGCTLERPGG